MSNSNETFDMQSLLAQGSLDIRGLAQRHPLLTVGEYYEWLSEFLTLAPNVSRALGRFENRDVDKEDRRSLNDMINLLETLGCEMFIVEFHSVLDAYEREGNWRLAATYARRIRGPWGEFHTAIERIRRYKPAKGAMAADGGEGQGGAAGQAADADAAVGQGDAAGQGLAGQNLAGQGEDLTLEDAIRQLDEAEAGRKLVILAVDDSPVILKSVWTILGDEYKVITLPNPLEVPNLLKKQKPDLFLLDYLMPEMNGFDLVPVIRSFEEHKNTPIVFLTSDGTIDNLTTALALGAKDFIVKPFVPDILREKVSKHITGGNY
ncbi:MAG: response regulator [Oscillospiraceae bacterium]|nr:response regulator [Oscillospiraceae bacterium]